MLKLPFNFYPMQHQPYRKIPESLQALQLSEADHRRIGKVDWVVTEKVHGANFCMLTDGEQVQFAKRKSLLDPEEDFFGYHALRPELIEKAQAIWAGLPKISGLRIYGELYGGGYPHPQVPTDPRVQPVQTGIWYHPSVQFICFDLAVAQGGTTRFLDFAELEQRCAAVELPCVRALVQGSWQEALAYPVEFPTEIPAQFGLPVLPDNLAEGVVLKPATDFRVTGPKGEIRPVLKRKLPRFAEDARFHGAGKWEAQASPVARSAVDTAFMVAEVAPLLTRTRLESAISKVGRLSARTRNRVLTEMVEDVLDSLSLRFSDLSEEETQSVREWATEKVRRMVK